MLRNNIN